MLAFHVMLIARLYKPADGRRQCLGLEVLVGSAAEFDTVCVCMLVFWGGQGEWRDAVL